MPQTASASHALHLAPHAAATVAGLWDLLVAAGSPVGLILDDDGVPERFLLRVGPDHGIARMVQGRHDPIGDAGKVRPLRELCNPDDLPGIFARSHGLPPFDRGLFGDTHGSCPCRSDARFVAEGRVCRNCLEAMRLLPPRPLSLSRLVALHRELRDEAGAWQLPEARREAEARQEGFRSLGVRLADADDAEVDDREIDLDRSRGSTRGRPVPTDARDTHGRVAAWCNLAANEIG